MEAQTLEALAGPDPLDLRRRDRQDAARRISSLADWLPPADAALLHAVYSAGQSVTELARIAGLSPPALRRRVRRLAARVLSEKFLFVARHLGGWPPTRRRVARLCVLEGVSMREAARRLGLSLHTVRKHCHAIDALFEAATR